MKLTTKQIKQLIKEELSKLLREDEEAEENQLVKQYMFDLIKSGKIKRLAIGLVGYIKELAEYDYEIDNLEEYMIDYISESDDFSPNEIYNVEKIPQQLMSRQSEPAISDFFNRIYREFSGDLQDVLKGSSPKRRLNRDDWVSLFGNRARSYVTVEEDIAYELIKTQKDEVIDLVVEIYSGNLTGTYKRTSQIFRDKEMLGGFERYNTILDTKSLYRIRGWPNLRVDQEDLARGVIEYFKDEPNLQVLLKEYAKIVYEMEDEDEEPGSTLMNILFKEIPELIPELNIVFAFEFLYIGSLMVPGGTNTLDPRIMAAAESDFMQGYEIWRSITPEKDLEKLLKLIKGHGDYLKTKSTRAR